MPAARKPKVAISTNATTASSSSLASPGPSSSSAAAARRHSTAGSESLTMTDTNNLPESSTAETGQWTKPPWMGFLETTEDALLILEAARRRMIPRVTRRLADRKRRLIQSGSVFVFEEEESGIKRWTDGFLWSPSRILGNFLLYRETDKRNPDGTPATRPGRSNTTSGASSLLVAEEPSYQSGSLSRPKTEDINTTGGYSAAGSSGLDRARERILLGSLTNSQKFKEDGMMKKTFSLTLPNSTKTHHLVSYYKVSDVEAGRLRTPSSLPEFMALEISPEFLDKTHFRVQPRVEVGEDGRVRFRGETTDEPDSPAPETSSHHVHSAPSHSHPHHPYPRPTHSRQSSTNVGTEYNALAAAAKAQAEASARMYMNGAAKVYQQNGVGVGTTASSLGLHYPSALQSATSPTAVASPTSMSSPVSYCGSTSGFYTTSPPPTAKPQQQQHQVCYYSDNSTGAPPFQAPQLYNPSQPSASANSAFATATYPASLAPSHRSAASVYSATPSVRSGSMSVSTGYDEDAVANVAHRSSRSGSGSSSAGSLTMASSTSSSEVATPSIASSRRTSTSAYHNHSRPDPLALGKMLAQTKAEQQQLEPYPELDLMNNLGFGGGYFNGPVVDDLTTNAAPNAYDAYGYASNTYVESPQTYFAPPSSVGGYSIPPPAQKQQQPSYQQQPQQQQQQMWGYDEGVQYGVYGGTTGFES